MAVPEGQLVKYVNTGAQPLNPTERIVADAAAQAAVIGVRAVVAAADTAITVATTARTVAGSAAGAVYSFVTDPNVQAAAAAGARAVVDAATVAGGVVARAAGQFIAASTQAAPQLSPVTDDDKFVLVAISERGDIAEREVSVSSLPQALTQIDSTDPLELPVVPSDSADLVVQDPITPMYQAAAVGAEFQLESEPEPEPVASASALTAAPRPAVKKKKGKR